MLLPLSYDRTILRQSTDTLSQAAGLALGLEKNQDIVLANWTREGLAWCDMVGRRCGGGIPGPLTFRMIDRVVSSMNSTRTWVTPPREPAAKENHLLVLARNRKTD